MAAVTVKYLAKCAAADPHIKFGVLVNGVQRLVLVDHLSVLTADSPDREDMETVARVLVQCFARKWKKANPSGTLAQFRTAVEAETWTV